MHLQVQRVSTEQIVYKNVMGKGDQKSDSSAGLGSGLDSKIEAMQTQRANFDAPDSVNMSKQQSNNTQCTAMYSGLWSKKTH